MKKVKEFHRRNFVALRTVEKVKRKEIYEFMRCSIIITISEVELSASILFTPPLRECGCVLCKIIIILPPNEFSDRHPWNRASHRFRRIIILIIGTTCTRESAHLHMRQRGMQAHNHPGIQSFSSFDYYTISLVRERIYIDIYYIAHHWMLIAFIKYFFFLLAFYMNIEYVPHSTAVPCSVWNSRHLSDSYIIPSIRH